MEHFECPRYDVVLLYESAERCQDLIVEVIRFGHLNALEWVVHFQFRQILHPLHPIRQAQIIIVILQLRTITLPPPLPQRRLLRNLNLDILDFV